MSLSKIYVVKACSFVLFNKSVFALLAITAAEPEPKEEAPAPAPQQPIPTVNEPIADDDAGKIPKSRSPSPQLQAPNKDMPKKAKSPQPYRKQPTTIFEYEEGR